ncbi:hypothetical protein QUB16_30610 [Microcoleus sp. D3_18a_C4]
MTAFCLTPGKSLITHCQLSLPDSAAQGVRVLYNIGEKNISIEHL